MAELANDMENFGSSCETCRKASVIVTLERTLRRLTEQFLNFDGRAKVLIAKLKSLIKSRSNLKAVFPKQQNAMGSLHNIDFGVFWASWGGSG